MKNGGASLKQLKYPFEFGAEFGPISTGERVITFISMEDGGTRILGKLAVRLIVLGVVAVIVVTATRTICMTISTTIAITRTIILITISFAAMVASLCGGSFRFFIIKYFFCALYYVIKTAPRRWIGNRVHTSKR